MEGSGQSAFEARADKGNGIVRLVLAGELDLGSVPALEEQLANYQDGSAGIILDLGDLTFIDSTGLRALLSASKRAKGRGQRFAIVGATPSAKSLFEITGTGWLLDEAEGLRLLQQFAEG